MSAPTHIPRALTIAGSDSGGGAGIQADLKAFARCGVHGMSALTAITAQNTIGVTAIQPVLPEVILAQIRAVIADIGVDAIKIGMLGERQATLAVSQALRELSTPVPVVLDPVMVSESGARLLDEDALDALIGELLPQATVVTPNLLEARILARGTPGADEESEVIELLGQLRQLGAKAVVLTGGHRSRAVDLLLDENAQITEIPGERHPDGAAHGSGCTHSSVIAAELAKGASLLQAARTARQLTGRAIANGLRELGEGAGPVDIIGLAGQD